jgi:hypothetical protein
MLHVHGCKLESENQKSILIGTICYGNSATSEESSTLQAALSDPK